MSQLDLGNSPPAQLPRRPATSPHSAGGTGRREVQVQRGRKGSRGVLSAPNWRCPFQPALWTWCSLWDGCGGIDRFFSPITGLRQTDGCRGKIEFPASGVLEGDMRAGDPYQADTAEKHHCCYFCGGWWLDRLADGCFWSESGVVMAFSVSECGKLVVDQAGTGNGKQILNGKNVN